MQYEGGKQQSIRICVLSKSILAFVGYFLGGIGNKSFYLIAPSKIIKGDYARLMDS